MYIFECVGSHHTLPFRPHTMGSVIDEKFPIDLKQYKKCAYTPSRS
jgi:hypothetical protein